MIDLGTKHQIPHLPVNSFLLANPTNTDQPSYRLCPNSGKYFSLHALPPVSPPSFPSCHIHIWLSPHIQVLSVALEDSFAGGI